MLLEKVTDPQLKELITLFLSEWMSKISREREKENAQKNKLVNDRFQYWEEMIKDKSSELKEEGQKFLDWIVGYYGEELENYYLYGLCDGIRIFKWLMRI